jgi:hypothetical protein
MAMQVIDTTIAPLWEGSVHCRGARSESIEGHAAMLTFQRRWSLTGVRRVGECPLDLQYRHVVDRPRRQCQSRTTRPLTRGETWRSQTPGLLVNPAESTLCSSPAVASASPSSTSPSSAASPTTSRTSTTTRHIPLLAGQAGKSGVWVQGAMLSQQIEIVVAHATDPLLVGPSVTASDLSTKKKVSTVAERSPLVEGRAP